MTFESWLQSCETALVIHTPARLRQDQAGVHRSCHLGRGFRLRHHDAYRPGDARRDIDWKASRKHQTLLVRRFETPKRLDVHVVCDVSASMLSGRDRSNLRTAIDCAGLLGLATLRQGNAFGLTLFAFDVVEHFPPRQSRHHLLHALDVLWHYSPTVSPPTQTRFSPVLSLMPVHRPALVVLVSDFRMMNWYTGWSQLNAVHDTIAVCIQDETLTTTLPLGGDIAVRDFESGAISRLAREQTLQRSDAPLIRATPTTDYTEELLRVFFSRSTISRT